MKSGTSLFVVLLLVVVRPACTQVVEKLDSLVVFEYPQGRITYQRILHYDAEARDTAVADYQYVEASGTLLLSRRERTNYRSNQRIIEHWSLTTAEVVERLTITLDDAGYEQERLTERLDPLTGQLLPYSRWETSLRDARQWIREQYHWDAGNWLRSGRQITEYQPAGGQVETTYQWLDEAYRPQQRITRLFDGQTAVDTLYLIENYYPATTRWAPFLRVRTVLDAENLLGARLTDVASFDTGLLDRFDSTAVSFNPDWTTREERSYRPRGAAGNYLLLEERQYTYTAQANIATRDHYRRPDETSPLELVQSDTYHYSQVDLATGAEAARRPFPLQLQYANPAVRPRVLLVGPDSGASYLLQLRDGQGRVLDKRQLRIGEWVELGPPHLASGWYVLTVIAGSQMKSWPMVVP